MVARSVVGAVDGWGGCVVVHMQCTDQLQCVMCAMFLSFVIFVVRVVAVVCYCCWLVCGVGGATAALLSTVAKYR